MAATHDSDVVITSSIDIPSSVSVAFGTPLYVVPLSANSLNSARTVLVTSATHTATLLASTYISAFTAEALTTAFAQSPRIKKILVASWDTTAPETAATALTAILAHNSNFYEVVIQSKADADIIAWATAINALPASTPRLMITQAYDADFLTDPSDWGTTGATYDALVALTRPPAILARGDDTFEVALAWAAERGRFDLEARSPDYQCELAGIETETTIVTTTSVDLMKDAYINVGAKWFDHPYFIKNGVLINGDPIKLWITIDWFRERIARKTADMFATLSARGEVWPCDSSGIILAQSIVTDSFNVGAAAGHFVSGQLAFDDELSSFNTTTKNVTVYASIQFVVAAQTFNFDFNFSPSAVVSEE